MMRSDTISELADMIAEIRLDHPVRVGIDGVDCAGKTMLANELVEPLEARGRNVIRASIDGFHNSRQVRHRQGRTSPKGYYEDSFNLDSILTFVLSPLGPGGNRVYQTARFDFMIDAEVDSPSRTAHGDDILVFEGLFLHRPELLSHWDFTVFVEANFDVTIGRACIRDLYLFETAERTKAIYEQRYIPGQELYLREQRPSEKATVIFANSDIENPKLTTRETSQQGDAGGRLWRR